MQAFLLLVTDEAADDERFAAVHAHVGVGCAAGDAVVLQLTDERGRADLSMHLGGDHPSVRADNRAVGKLDAGVEVFRRRIGAAAVMLFGLHRDMVTDEDARLASGNGDNARSGENFGFAAGD